VVFAVPCARTWDGLGEAHGTGNWLEEEANMPTYEYECRQCKKTFTDRQTFQEHDEHKQVKCPKCDSTDVRQVIGRTFAKTSKKS
jgi:putative FmdB family regulatory protein